MKTYSFECNMTSVGRGYVEAESKEEAIQKILNDDYDDIYDEFDTEITEVVEIWEDVY